MMSNKFKSKISPYPHMILNFKIISESTIDSSLRAYHKKGNTKTYAWRKSELEAFLRMLNEKEQDLHDAIAIDNGKSEWISWAFEINPVKQEIYYALDNLKGWMASRSVPTDLLNIGGSSEVHYDPLGVVTVISSYNYPIQLTLSPLVGAISAGNCAFIKVSEACPNVANTLEKLFGEYMDDNAFKFILGAIPETTELLKLPVDLIFFTGSQRVGKIVAHAAAEHLTPVVLELGGKSPVVIDESADLSLAARRVIWGKGINSGQTCISPDYMLVHESVAERFKKYLVQELETQWPDMVDNNPDYARIQGQTGYNRILKMLNESKEYILHGGQSDAESRLIDLTILDYGNNKDKFLESSCMQDEIFGPLFPMMQYSHVSEVIDYLQDQDKPLVIYCFTRDKHVKRRFVKETSSGQLIFNDVFMHMNNPNLPFGGVGKSGHGSYHGFYSFRAFSHEKAILNKSRFLDIPIRYPPYNGHATKVKLMRLLATARPVWAERCLLRGFGMIAVAAVGVVAYFAYFNHFFQ